MMDRYKLEQLKNKYEKWCYEHRFSSDLFDFQSNVDSTLDYYENWNIIEKKLNVLAESGTLDRENFKKLKASNEQKEKANCITCLNSLKILSNSLSLVIGKTNEAKTAFLCELIKDYKSHYSGDVYVFGMADILIEKMKVKKFSSLLEMEKIKNSIIIIDECKSIFSLEDRKMTPLIDSIIRLVVHKNNKLVLSGLPSDFKKYICAKANCFCYKALDFSDLINGSRAKEIIGMYKGAERGAYTLDLKKSEVLIYDGSFEIETFAYNPEYDTKKDNLDLFVPKKVPENVGNCENKILKNVETPKDLYSSDTHKR